MLTHWGRTLGKFSTEELIRRLTSDPASAAGLHDRGILRPGMKADVNIIDWDRLGSGKPYIAHDLPAGGKRLLQDVYGYEATIVAGQVTYREGQATGALPGKLVRGPQAGA
jgi:N-acyl-D-aspartate/D-glutamate deacylase